MSTEYSKTRSDVCALCGRNLLVCRMAACVWKQMAERDRLRAAAAKEKP